MSRRLGILLSGRGSNFVAIADAIAQGKLDANGTFIATEVLAKHDENYMPPEAAKALNDAHVRGVQKQQMDQSGMAAPVGEAKPKAAY